MAVCRQLELITSIPTGIDSARSLDRRAYESHWWTHGIACRSCVVCKAYIHRKFAHSRRWFCSSYLPLHAPTAHRRPNPLATPIRFRALFAPRRGNGSTYGPTPTSTSTASSTSTQTRQTSDAVEAVRHRWGGGQRLGG